MLREDPRHPATRGDDDFIGVFSYAGMPPDEAERSLRLFAAEVMPELAKVGDVPLLQKTA